MTLRVDGPRPGLPVAIEYARAGGGTVTYRQRLVRAGPDAIVTLQSTTPLDEPKEVDGTVVLEPDAPVVWFTFEGVWHDVGAFHLADGTFTGWYANVLTPVELAPPEDGVWRWKTTDLCLDVWSGDTGVTVLDEDELARAERSGTLQPEIAARAREEARRIVRAARNEEWPPAVVDEWPLERARAALGDAGSRP